MRLIPQRLIGAHLRQRRDGPRFKIHPLKCQLWRHPLPPARITVPDAPGPTLSTILERFGIAIQESILTYLLESSSVSAAAPLVCLPRLTKSRQQVEY